MSEIIIENAIKYIGDLFQDNTDGHDINHSLRVYNNAMNIAAAYSSCDKMVVALAALLHDVDDHKLFRTVNNENARKFLSSQDIEQEKIDLICNLINSVSFSKNRGNTPECIEGKIVQDADRLDAIGAIGIARTFAYGGKNGRTLTLSVQHFYDKLLLLKYEMNTKEAKEIANNRHSFMEMFLNELDKELKAENADLSQILIQNP